MSRIVKFYLKQVLAIILFCLMSLVGVSVSSSLAEQPTNQDNFVFATETADLLQAELFAALVQEFSETTPENVEQGKLAISLIFDDSHTNFRLIGQEEPISSNDLPQDSFEQQALELALKGETFDTFEKVRGKFFYRRSIPLANFDSSCALCHQNFGAVDPEQFVGALVLKIPTKNNTPERFRG